MPKGKQSSSNYPASIVQRGIGGPNPSPPHDPSNIVYTGYEIRIKDHLETYWYEWFEGWSMTNLENGEVVLRRYNVDQSAVHGALNKIRDLNLVLLSMTRIE
jgi:hypothetical protein